MAGEVTWEDESDVREIIADVRDAECEMTWCVSHTGAPLLPTGAAIAAQIGWAVAAHDSCVSTERRSVG